MLWASSWRPQRFASRFRQSGSGWSYREESKLARKKNKPVNFYVLVLMVMFVVGGFAVAAFIHHPGDAEAGQGRITDRSRICMLQDTVQPRAGLAYVYHGKKYYLCCGGCLAAFQSDAANHSSSQAQLAPSRDEGESIEPATRRACTRRISRHKPYGLRVKTRAQA